MALPAAAAALVAGLVATPLARTFVAAQPLKGDRPPDEIRCYSATPRDYFRANIHSALWDGRMLPYQPERGLFPGVAPLVLGAIGAAPPLSGVRLVYLVGLLVSLDCSFGFNGALYPLLHRSFPPIRGLRVPARFSALVGLTLSILAGFGVRRILGWSGSHMRKRAVIGTLAALVAIDAWPALALVPVWKEPPAIYDTLKARPGVVLAEFPVDANEVFNIPFIAVPYGMLHAGDGRRPVPVFGRPAQDLDARGVRREGPHNVPRPVRRVVIHDEHRRRGEVLEYFGHQPGDVRRVVYVTTMVRILLIA